MTVRLSSKPYSLLSKHHGCRQDMEFDQRGPCSLSLAVRASCGRLAGLFKLDFGIDSLLHVDQQGHTVVQQ